MISLQWLLSRTKFACVCVCVCPKHAGIVVLRSNLMFYLWNSWWVFGPGSKAKPPVEEVSQSFSQSLQGAHHYLPGHAWIGLVVNTTGPGGLVWWNQWSCLSLLLLPYSSALSCCTFFAVSIVNFLCLAFSLQQRSLNVKVIILNHKEHKREILPLLMMWLCIQSGNWDCPRLPASNWSGPLGKQGTLVPIHFCLRHL